ncbi:MAG TPA: flagellar basal-body MS-ring/collar protein FliF, partial [Polyangiales bacterium]|nr:flagellar basal-body MS-ring/collar protein FliF [Polyangiales bacterium]
MADWAARIAPWKERWAQLALMARVGVISGAVLLLGAIAFGLSAERTPAKGVLFSNLGEDDAARIVLRLKAANIPYELGPDGASILVPQAQVHETRLMLASEGLPSGGGVGFEVFDQQRFGESEFSEQVKYHRALEGELARTISHLAGVKRARVHLVLPARTLFASTEQDASASVVVHLIPGWKMRDEQVKGIVHLVASSVRGLDAERVTLVDGEGRPLGGGQRNDGELAGEADGYRREIEKGKERSAQQMLDTTLGQGKSMVRVAAQVSFTREETTEELYDKEAVAPRSFQIVEEREGGDGKLVGGIPGAPSNLPGGSQPTFGSGGGGVLTRRSETRNFEVSKTLRRAVEPVGRVIGMQVAVVVDGRYTGKDEKRRFEALRKDELDRIRNVVASAVGIDEKRGDRVVVECVPFAPQPAPLDDRSMVEKALGPYTNYALLALVALLVLIIFMVGRKTLRSRPIALAKGSDVLAAPLLAGMTDGSLAAGGGALGG